MYTILFNTLENTLARKTCEAFIEDGHNVYVLQTQKDDRREVKNITFIETDGSEEAIEQALDQSLDKIDMLVLSLPDEKTIGDDDYDAVLNTLTDNAYFLVMAAKGSLSKLRKSSSKRIAFLSDEMASIRETLETTGYGYHMSQAACSLAMKILFNTYRPEGFTFRCFAESAGGMEADEYLLTDQSYIETDDYIHSDENRLVLRNGFLREL